MSKYDDLFDETRPDGRIFADKSALDPLADPDEIIARDDQERRLATLLNGVHEGYLPTTVSIYGPPGTGKTMTTRLLCQAFAARNEHVAVEYVNLKECRTLFSAANEILLELTGETKRAYEGLDGVFTAIWEALETYPDYTILILDEIDHIGQDRNYDPNDFFYRLLRGEGRLKRGLNLSVFLISNQLLEVDLRLDSRVQSAMSGEHLFFPPYSGAELERILEPRLERAFQDGALTEDVVKYGISVAATRWGDVRKALTLFRKAGETAKERGLDHLTEACFDENVEATTKASVVEKLLSLPVQHFFVLLSIAGWAEQRSGKVIQPVTTDEVWVAYNEYMNERSRASERTIRELITDLETMGLVETWIHSKGREGRVKQIETTFDPGWVQELAREYVEQSPYVETIG